jgi:hypothetical protein
MLYIFILLVFVIVSIIFRLASALGLTLPLAYGLIAPTLFYNWFHSNQVLAEGIGWALVGIVILSWVISLIRKIREMIIIRKSEQVADEILLNRIKKAQSEGMDMSEVSKEDFYRGC